MWKAKNKITGKTSYHKNLPDAWKATTSNPGHWEYKPVVVNPFFIIIGTMVLVLLSMILLCNS